MAKKIAAYSRKGCPLWINGGGGGGWEGVDGKGAVRDMRPMQDLELKLRTLLIRG